MADVFTQGGSQAVVSVPSPYLLGNIIPSANELRPSNSLGLVQPIGFGTTTRRFVDESPDTEEGQSQASDLAAIVAAVSNSSNYGETLRYDISGITGAVGPQGPPGATIINSGLPGGIGAGGIDGSDGADGVDAFDDIDIPIPYDGWEGAFTDNSDDGTEDSQAGSVHWTAFKVKYKGTAYQVVTGNTALAFLYWDVSDPLVVTPTATRSNSIGIGKFVIGWNNSGTFTPSQFSKLVTAGYLDVVDLAALGITVVNADIGTAAIETANIKNLNVDGTKLAALAASTAKIANSATKIWNSSAGQTVAHTTGGGSVEILATASFTATSSPSVATFTITYGGGTLVSGVISINSGTTQSLTLNCVSSGSKTASMNGTIAIGTGSIAYNYIRTMEDKGK